MMPFHDLNVVYKPGDAGIAQTLSFLAELEYSVVALSSSVSGKLPATPEPIKLPDAPRGMTLLTRLNLTVSDPSQNHRLPSLQSSYSLIALRPTTDKALQLCCGSLECDIISLDLSTRLPFILKFKTVASALQRGVRFEICYSPGIVGGSDARRNLITGATSLIRATRGRGIIVSSEAKNVLGCRGPWDVINLAQIWGLNQERGKEAVCEEAGKVTRLAKMKRESFRGVVHVIDGNGLGGNTPALKEEIKKLAETNKIEHENAGVKRKPSATELPTHGQKKRNKKEKKKS
jgi:ribonuclease P/MRP protein subunit RPP1